MLFFSIPTDSRGSLSKEVLSGNAYCIRKFECAISSAFVRLLDVSRSHYWTEKGILSESLMPSIFGVRKTTAALRRVWYLSADNGDQIMGNSSP